MNTIKLKSSNGTSMALKMPTDLSDVPLPHKISFDVFREDVALWTAEQVDDDKFMDNSTYYLYLVSKAVSEFIQQPLHSLMKLDADDLVDSKGELKPLVLKEHFEQLESGKYDVSQENTILSLYALCCQCCDKYKFEFKEKRIFKHKGKKWVIPHYVRKMFTGSTIFGKFSIQQSVEILQIKRFLTQFAENHTRVIGDTQKIQDARYSGFLKMLAISLREEGEEFPLDDGEFEDEMEKRMLLFQNIDSRTAYDITFFLTTIITSSVPEKVANTFSTHLNTKLTKV